MLTTSQMFVLVIPHPVKAMGVVLLLASCILLFVITFVR